MSTTLASVAFVAAWLLTPAVLVALVARGVARGRGKRRGQPPGVISGRGWRAFWLAVVIVVALELILFGACVAMLSGI